MAGEHGWTAGELESGGRMEERMEAAESLMCVFRV